MPTKPSLVTNASPLVALVAALDDFSVVDRVALSSALGLGEAAVIHAALTQAIPTVVIDERKGRRWAAMHGLRVTGSLGVLLALHRRGLVPTVGAAVGRMKSKGIHISPALVAEALALAGER
jgi:hypothetical protein